MVLQRENEQDSSDLTPEMIELQTTKTLAFTMAVKNALENMVLSGTDVDSLDFAKPDDASFDTPPYYNKVYHPEGGGLSYNEYNPSFAGMTSGSQHGWYLGKFNNVEWTPTTAQDVILTAYLLSPEVCSNINKRLTGDPAIPETNFATWVYTIDGSITSDVNVDLTETECPDCEGKPSLCVTNTLYPDEFTFYTIILAQ